MTTVRSGLYRHYKGNAYRVLGMARHSETEESMVIYQNLYDAFELWVRPAAMFAENVEINGKMVPRFAYEGDAPGIAELIGNTL
ncbi:hypothetical protein FHW69_000125 [Luteibacter sp. Sphag1AF]|uniref:DUF1653 domain-containing protein n=1 Tax=Luteibacter sp. Sphag1AF TaxID=2587031 RepID=UPI0016103320|nr:DUF1653 domain-containing protein [Luteibacter sp. Sphag1AF]MBB3225535.1 hypothetical protein [Luteibacter sp. Sphag1AF]